MEVETEVQDMVYRYTDAVWKPRDQVVSGMSARLDFGRIHCRSLDA